MRYRFERHHDIYNDGKLESERYYQETPESDARQTNYLKQRFPKITNTITSISFEYDEIMVDTAAALELDEITGIAKALGGIETICTSN